MSLLWESAPSEGRSRWFTQRHMLERLQEEIARTQRHPHPLTVVLGEVRVDEAEGARPTSAPHLTAWTTEQLGKVKRRSDVAGQYGPQGFLLLLPETTTEGAIHCCRRLQRALEQASPPAGSPGPVRSYLGIASFSEATRTAKSLLSSAEQRLEKAKQSETEHVVAE